MKHRRFSDEQVIGVLEGARGWGKVDDICRRDAISTATFTLDGRKYGGMEATARSGRLRWSDFSRGWRSPGLRPAGPAIRATG